MPHWGRRETAAVQRAAVQTEASCDPHCVNNMGLAEDVASRVWCAFRGRCSVFEVQMSFADAQFMVNLLGAILFTAPAQFLCSSQAKGWERISLMLCISSSWPRAQKPSPCCSLQRMLPVRRYGARHEI